MRNRKLVVAVATISALAIAAAPAALAGGHGPRATAGERPAPAEGMRGLGMGPFGGPGAPGLGGGLRLPLHRLDLTDEQRAAIRAVFDAEQPSLLALRGQIRDAQESFAAAHPPAEFDEAAIRAHQAEVAPLLADLAVAEARVRAKALATLTPAQLGELEAMRAERHERTGVRRGMRRGL